MAEGRRGAARSETARLAILHATVHQFAERGYDHLTMEGIAAEAGVGKQTIYRWWPSKGALVAECLLEGMLMPDRFLPPDTGDVRADLTTWLDEVLGFIGDERNEALLRSLVAAASENAEVGRRLDESIFAGSALVTRLEAAVEASDLRADAPIPEIIEALVGALVFRVLTRAAVSPGLAERLVAAVIGPATQAPAEDAPPAPR
ncbi:TetR/AcrR family transcriptional regulator [Agromyces aerolatus]|uniref:TetR/AcrR family transcriptional regulator n=1 Tax=Agromyces sp. LY-1074 TaxID=3074080 RepID=UPI00285F5AB2|nr:MULTISPECIES: TetR/AcrR family transcriptional regulator [unclassified Agromyces]MDR5699175.1 TetR/AcrR family transcriptional regulator [Agromyces sp. LY-1074]MDR5705470.1 TetR/AcrR family transcriptional regulator [Agromyces sp. LY-1358]